MSQASDEVRRGHIPSSAPNSEQNLRFIDAPADSSVPPPLSVPVGSPGASASSVGPDDDDDDPFLKLREDDDLDAGVAVTMPAEMAILDSTMPRGAV